MDSDRQKSPAIETGFLSCLKFRFLSCKVQRSAAWNYVFQYFRQSVWPFLLWQTILYPSVRRTGVCFLRGANHRVYFGLKLYEIQTYITFSCAPKWVSERTNERSGSHERREHHGTSEWVSGASEWASGQASDPVQRVTQIGSIVGLRSEVRIGRGDN